MARPILPGITPPFLVMMMREQDELTARINALTATTQSPQFESADEWTQYLLVAQLTAMQSYSAILGLRIHAYNQTPRGAMLPPTPLNS